MRSGYSISGALRGIVIATTIAGTLEILSVFAFGVSQGASPLGVLGGIGSALVDRGAIGNEWVLGAIGLALHFGIMAVMATAYVLVAALLPFVNRVWLLSGIVFGAILWGIMERVVLPYRWPTMFPLTGTPEIAEQLFDHIVLVGLPIAWIARRAARWKRRYI